jgi:dihydroneopterin aldolase
VIQKVVASKKKQLKLWQKSRKIEDWIEYKNVCKIVKSVVSKVKLNRYDELYEKLGTQEGEK